jgi:hypothetical protein
VLSGWFWAWAEKNAASRKAKLKNSRNLFIFLMFSELKPKLWIDYKYAPIRKNTKFLGLANFSISFSVRRP